MTIDVQCQDHMAWETQGPISDRTHERLATSDHGIVMLREMMTRELDKMEKGLDPLGVIRNPAENTVIDTKLAQSLKGPEFRRDLRTAAAGG
jgi:5,5'-dehydrodivanillate O-demethylase